MDVEREIMCSVSGSLICWWAGCITESNGFQKARRPNLRIVILFGYWSLSFFWTKEQYVRLDKGKSSQHPVCWAASKWQVHWPSPLVKQRIYDIAEKMLYKIHLIMSLVENVVFMHEFTILGLTSELQLKFELRQTLMI